MKTRDDIIADMARAMFEHARQGLLNPEPGLKISNYEDITFENSANRQVLLSVAAAALDALLNGLPNLPMDSVNGIETDARLYNQLLRMRRLYVGK